jgi:hypothetical protein
MIRTVGVSEIRHMATFIYPANDMYVGGKGHSLPSASCILM